MNKQIKVDTVHNSLSLYGL